MKDKDLKKTPEHIQALIQAYQNTKESLDLQQMVCYPDFENQCFQIGTAKMALEYLKIER